MNELSALLASLDVAREDESPTIPWLETSYSEPDDFWADCARFAASPPGPPPRSRKGVACDLYTDAVARHARSELIAFEEYDPRQGWTSLSFADLDAQASSLARAWRSQGVQAGASVALVLPLGARYVVAFAAALRLGACVSPLDPVGGEAYLHARLSALKPSHVLLDEPLPAPVGQFVALALQGAPHGPRPLAPAHVFAPKEPCASIFSPCRSSDDGPIPLPAEVAYENALRDALLALRLARGRRFAAPGAHPQQHHPALLLSSLLAGATFVHARIEDLKARPAVLGTRRLDTLMVTAELRDALIGAPGHIGSVSHWLRCADEPLDWFKWREFATKNCADEVLSSNILVDAAVGGSVLFSTRRPRQSVHSRVSPSAGRPWTLVGPAHLPKGVPAAHGTFVPAPDKSGALVLARSGGEFLWAGTVQPRRASRVFPSTELCAFVAAIPDVVGACVAPVAAHTPGPRYLFVLLVFLGTASLEGARSRVESAVRGAYGADFQPDGIEVLPLFPRWKGKAIDAEWCVAQYVSGRLTRKAGSAAFGRLTALRGAIERGQPA